eukprot:COSAG02_NODE_3219_length_7155_cov_4.534864_8_plen_22_part_01
MLAGVVPRGNIPAALADLLVLK